MCSKTKHCTLLIQTNSHSKGYSVIGDNSSMSWLSTTDGKQGIHPNSPISSIEFLDWSNTRDNDTMYSAQQEHQTGVHSMNGDRT